MQINSTPARADIRTIGFWRTVTSVPVVTLLLLIGLDVFLRQGNFLDKAGYRTIDVWNLPVRLEAAIRTAPDVALVGPSLVAFLNRDRQGLHAYSGFYPAYLRRRLRQDTGQPVTCANLATGVQMVSESYLITSALAFSQNRPAVILYGTGLRDFVQDDYAREWRCDSFACLAPYVPMYPEVLFQIPSFKARWELFLCHWWCLYRQRNDFRVALSGITKDLLENLPLDQPYCRLGPDRLNWLPQKNGILYEKWIAWKQFESPESLALGRSHLAYVRQFFRNFFSNAYNNSSSGTRWLETHYLESMIHLCREQGIMLVIINMPIGADIVGLTPPKLYDAYHSMLRSLPDLYNVRVLDYFNDSRFTGSDFSDGVHLSVSGVQKFSDRLVEDLKSKCPEVLSAISRRAQARSSVRN